MQAVMEASSVCAETTKAKDDALKAELYNKVKGHRSVGYSEARRHFFSDIDNVDGFVTCVYTGRKLKTSGIPNGSNMNCEHTWPQSKGATGDAKSDIHHLYPTDSKANSKRGSFPFGNVGNVKWEEGGSKFGSFSKNENDRGYVFEPRDDHKGDVARSMFYFSLRYRLPIDSKQESALREWHEKDPVSQKEIDRNDKIEAIQKNRNPFVDNPEYVKMISDF